MTDLPTTNRVGLKIVREVTFGVTPTSPAFKALRQTSSGLNANPQTIITNEIRSDRQVTDLILVGQNAGGDIGGELSFKAFDDIFEEALQGTWSNKPYIEVLTTDTEISDVSATTLTVASGGGSFKGGHLTLTTGFSTTADNLLARVSSSSATTIVYPGSTFTAQASVNVGANVRVVGFQGASGDLVAVADGITSTALDFTTLGLVVGEWVKVGGDGAGNGFATAANAGFARISVIAAGKLTFDILPTGWTTDAGTGKTVQVFTGDVLTNASTKRSNTIERSFADQGTPSYEYLVGMTLNSLKIDAKAKAVATLTTSYMGKQGSTVTARVAGATDIAAPAYGVLNTSSNVGRIGFDGSSIIGPNFVLSASIEFNNNIRMQDAIGSVGAVGTGNGEFDVKGTLQTYFGDNSVYNKILNNTLTSFDIRFGRSDGNRETVLIDIPALKFASGAPAVPGKNQDVLINGNFQGIMHATLGYSARVQRHWYLPIA